MWYVGLAPTQISVNVEFLSFLIYLTPAETEKKKKKIVKTIRISNYFLKMPQ